MIKFIVPGIIIFLIIIFWDKIQKIVLEKFNIKLTYIAISIILIIFSLILLLLKY